MARSDRTSARTERRRATWRRPRLLVVLVAIAALAMTTSCGSDAGGRSTAATVSSDEIQGVQRDQPLDVGAVTLPQVTAGAPDVPFTMRAPAGQLLFVYFGYTHCPDLCPTTLADLRKALAQLGPASAAKVQLAFVTVDPERDTSEVLNPYLASFVTGAHALRTTDQDQLKAAEDAFLASSTVVERPDGVVEVSHTATSYLVDSRGLVVDELPFGTGADVMANDLRLVLGREADRTG